MRPAIYEFMRIYPGLSAWMKEEAIQPEDVQAVMFETIGRECAWVTLQRADASRAEHIFTFDELHKEQEQMEDHTVTTQGDILFFTNSGTWQEDIIAWWTGSEIVHCGIDMGDGTIVEALGSGIARASMGTRKFLRWSYTENAKDADPVDMEGAVLWLVGDGTPMHPGMVGKKYGWSDIAVAANLLQKFFYIVSPQHYDCSALATQFLDKAGGVDLCGLGEEIHTATPARLAKCLGIIA